MQAFGSGPSFRRKVGEKPPPDVFAVAVPNEHLAGKARLALSSKELLWYKTRHIRGALRHILVDPTPDGIKGDQRQRSRLAPIVEHVAPEPMGDVERAGVNWGPDILRDCLPSVDGTMLHDLVEHCMRRRVEFLDDCVVFTEVLKLHVSYRKAFLWEFADKDFAELRPVVCLHLPLGSVLGLLKERWCRQQPEREILWDWVLRLLATIVEVLQVECDRHRLAGSGCQQEFDPLSEGGL